MSKRLQWLEHVYRRESERNKDIRRVHEIRSRKNQISERPKHRRMDPISKDPQFCYLSDGDAQDRIRRKNVAELELWQVPATQTGQNDQHYTTCLILTKN